MRRVPRRAVVRRGFAVVLAMPITGCIGDGDDGDGSPVQAWIEEDPATIVIEAMPVSDGELAAALSINMTAAESALAGDILDGGSVRQSAEGPVVRDGIPFVYDDRVISFVVEAVGDELGYRSVVSLTPGGLSDVSRTAVPPDEVFGVTELPTVDRERLFPDDDWLAGDLPGEVRTGATYGSEEAVASVVAPNPAVTVIEWPDDWAVLEVHSTEVLSMSVYEYTLELHDESAAAVGRELREAYGIELEVSDGAVAAVLDEAIASDEGYRVDTDGEMPAGVVGLIELLSVGSVLPPFFHARDIQPEGPSGRYVVSYQGSVYLLSVSLDEREGGVSIP